MSIMTIAYNHFASDLQAVDSEHNQDLGQLMEPDPLAFSFDTPGWKVLGVLLLVMLTVILYKRITLYRKNAYRREALKKVKNLESEQLPENQKILGLQVVLKQVAMLTYGREQVAALYGVNWLRFLDAKMTQKGFVDYSEFFEDVIYSDKEADQTTRQKIFKLSKTWIHAHS